MSAMVHEEKPISSFSIVREITLHTWLTNGLHTDYEPSVYF